MIPIIYDKNETAFASNGLGRLRDIISAVVIEERNSIFELDFEYPVTGANFDLIQIGRIVCVTHDDSGDIQPFDIVSYSKPINGIITFHAVHISYRQSYLTVTGSNIQSLSAAFSALGNAEPDNPFIYNTNKVSNGNLTCMDGTPRSVRQVLGGIEGSILDIYGGEYEWNKWTVNLWSNRGNVKDFAIRYGVNLLDYNEEYDSANCFSSCIPYWTDGETTVVGDKQTSIGTTPAGREQCVPLDVSEKFDDQPTKAQVEQMGLDVIKSNNPTIPTQNIKVSFVRLQDMGEYSEYKELLQCRLCDTIRVIFPDTNSSGQFKIVKTVWNVLTDKYDEMELGDLSLTLSEALGLMPEGGSGYSGGSGGTDDYNDLINKPQINSVTLSGNKSLHDLGFATVASSGDYDDLTNKPSLAAVATSGDYDDLIDKPTIPTVNDATLTIQKNGTNVETFTANASSNVTANITVPTNVSDLNNDSNYISSPNIPYCTCATAAGTKAKTTTIVSGTFTANDLVTGAQVLVKFTNSNTVADPTLKIGSTTAKTIKRYGTTAPSTSAASSWNAGSVIMFTYDGTYWQMTDFNNTTYSSMTVAEYEAGTGTTARIITPARLKGAIQYWDAVTSVNSKTGAVTLTASDVGALSDSTTYVSSFNGNSGAVTYTAPVTSVNSKTGAVTLSASDVGALPDNYTAPVTSVNSKTGAVTLTASDVGALPDTTVIPSKLSDLTNDLIYDLGTVTPNDGVFSVSNDDVTAITALWNNGFCALKLSVNSKDYYAYKERIITYNGLNFMGFVAVEADITGIILATGKTLVGINANGIGMFAVIPDITAEDVQVEVSSGLAGKQDTLVSGTNIKTINSQSLLGSGDLSITVTGTKNIWYGTCSTAASTNNKVITTTSGDFVRGTGNMLRVCFTYAAGQGGITLNVDSTGATNAYYDEGKGTQLNREAWAAGEVIDFVYDGSHFIISDGCPASSTHWGKTLLEDSVSSTSTSMAATPNSVKTAYDLADTANTLAGTALQNTGGEVTGNVILKAPAGQNSPSLIFQRGTFTDNYNDWQIYDKSGFLYFGQRGQNSTAFADQVYFNTTGGVVATSFTGSGANLTGVVTSVNGSSGAITGIQTTGNLVTSVSSTSTDTEYPSAKCLYNYTKTICQGTGTDATLSLTAATITQIPLKSFTYTDQTHLSGNVSGTDYGIDVLTHGLYKISASVHYSTASGTTAIGCYVKAGTNGATFANATEIVGLVQAPCVYSYNAAIVTKLVELQVNDRLYLGGRNVGANGTANPDNAATYLCVEFVKAL